MINWLLTRAKPFPHQIEDTQSVLDKPAYVLGLEMGLGKSRIVIDAACTLYKAGAIDTLLIVCPAPVRSVWIDPDPVLGEFAKWVWESVPHNMREYHARTPLPKQQFKGLQLIVTNPEFLRRAERLAPLLEWTKTRRVMLVVDESWQYSNYRSLQTKALVKLGHVAERVYLLNGTLGSPEHVYSQLQILPVDIFNCRNYWVWRARYCKLGGYRAKQIVGYTDMPEFHRRTAPYVVRRLSRDCLDLPPVAYTQIEARLTPATWAHYTALRDELVTWLSKNEVCTAEQAGVRVLRLAQITAGFLGGVTASPHGELYDEPVAAPTSGIREIGREKLDALMEWFKQNPVNKAVVWGRFRAEIERTAAELQKRYPTYAVRKLYGGQTVVERTEVKQLLAPGGPSDASIVVGSPQAGGAGLNFAAANVAVYLTNSFSLKDRLQSQGRLDRPGQSRPVLYVDVAACGPNGERTLDHTVIAALRKKQDLSELTAAAWRTILTEGTALELQKDTPLNTFTQEAA